MTWMRFPIAEGPPFSVPRRLRIWRNMSHILGQNSRSVKLLRTLWGRVSLQSFRHEVHRPCLVACFCVMWMWRLWSRSSESFLVNRAVNPKMWERWLLFLPICKGGSSARVGQYPAALRIRTNWYVTSATPLLGYPERSGRARLKKLQNEAKA